MSIIDYINQRKAEFFIAKDETQMRAQAEHLASERARLEREKAARQNVIQEQMAIHGMRQENFSDRVSGIDRFRAVSAKANEFMVGTPPQHFGHLHDERAGTPTPKGGIFSNPSMPEPHPWVKEAFGK